MHRAQVALEPHRDGFELGLIVRFELRDGLPVEEHLLIGPEARQA